MTEIVPSALRQEGPTASRARCETLAEVWGDVVDLRHLSAAIAIGAAVSLGLYSAFGWLLAGRVATPEIGRSYAMLAGLMGCVIGGVICARAFPPKRTMTENSAGSRGGADGASPRDDLTLPLEVAEEMRALGLMMPEPDPKIIAGTQEKTAGTRET